MFVALEPIEVKKKPRQRQYPKKKVIKGGYYYSLRFPIIKGIPDWDGLITSERLLIPDNLNPPKRISRFGTDEFKIKLGCEALINLLKSEKCDCIVYDKMGLYSDLTERIIPVSHMTAVYTDNKEKYYLVRDKCFYNCGSFLQINSCAGLRRGYAFTPDGMNNHIPKENFNPITGNFINDKNICLPFGYERYLPFGVSKFSFAEALYTRCHIGSLSDYLICPKNP